MLLASAGPQWIANHSWVLIDEPPPYHAASYRQADLLSYQKIMVITVDGRNYFLRPEDARQLLLV